MKRRSRQILELKVRRLVGDQLDLGSGLVGRLEVWQKLSPADGLVELEGNEPWIDIHKVIIKRRFPLDGGEIVFSPDATAPTRAGCDAEVVAVTMGDIEAWTFAFAAYGPTTTRRNAIAASLEALLAKSPLPHDFDASLCNARGYPAWLALVTPGPHVVTCSKSWDESPMASPG